MTPNSKTIAFDNALKVWKTRYSFTPTNYAYLDKKMFTGRENNIANELAWIHDTKGAPINNFYNIQYHSGLKASFNKDLSANKIYKSLSLEGTENLQGGTSKFLANNSSQKSQARDAAVGKLSEKGGILYANLGRNPKTTGSNLKLAGVVTGAEQIFTGANTGQTKYGFAYDSSLYLFKIDFINGFNLSSNLFDIHIGNATTSGMSQIIPSVFHQPNSEPNNKSNAKLPNGLIVQSETNLISVYIALLNTEAEAGTLNYVYVRTPNSVNGGDPKGQYADIELEFGTYGTEDFELDVLNLNYERTSLDHSS